MPQRAFPPPRPKAIPQAGAGEVPQADLNIARLCRGRKTEGKRAAGLSHPLSRADSGSWSEQRPTGHRHLRVRHRLREETGGHSLRLFAKGMCLLRVSVRCGYLSAASMFAAGI